MSEYTQRHKLYEVRRRLNDLIADYAEHVGHTKDAADVQALAELTSAVAAFSDQTLRAPSVISRQQAERASGAPNHA